MTAISAIPSVEAIPAILARASSTLDAAKSSAEILEARDTAAFACDAAKSAARINRAKGAHDDLVPAPTASGRGATDRRPRQVSPCRGIRRGAGTGRGGVEGSREMFRMGTLPTVEDIGLTRKDIFEARQVRDAEARSPGIVNKAIGALVEAGKEPTRTAVRRAIIKRELGIAATA